jgi:hypothetical protein
MNLPMSEAIHDAPALTITIRPIASGPAAGNSSPSKRTALELAAARPLRVSIHACGCSAISLRR